MSSTINKDCHHYFVFFTAVLLTTRCTEHHANIVSVEKPYIYNFASCCVLGPQWANKSTQCYRDCEKCICGYDNIKARLG